MEPTAGSTSSTETEREPAERVSLGRVVGAHGMGGQLRVRYFGGVPDNLIRLEAVLLAEKRLEQARKDRDDVDLLHSLHLPASRETFQLAVATSNQPRYLPTGSSYAESSNPGRISITIRRTLMSTMRS